MHSISKLITYAVLINLFLPAFTLAKQSQSINAPLIKQGKDLYQQSCVFCHQPNAIGKAGMAPSLTNKEFLSIASPDFLFSTISNGRPGGGMPPFNYLGKKKIEAIIAYLTSHASLPSRIKEIDKQPKSKGNPGPGKKLFDAICASCHGPDGNGYRAGGTGTAIGKKGFLKHASDGFIRTTIKEGRSNTRMRGFHGPEGLANLSDREIDDIIAFMRSLEQ